MSKFFADFSKQGYTSVLKNAKEKGFHFLRFSEMHTATKTNTKYCLIRHDIDVSLKCALEMAQIEYDLGISATYFLMLRSPAYNLLGRYAYSVLEKIKEMGHEIALHFDAAHPAVQSNDIVNEILKELKILETISKQNIKAVSFHQPSLAMLNGDIMIPDVINTYHKEQMKGWCYVSDSNRIWKEYDAISVFDNQMHTHVQLLTHPIWWIYDDISTEDAWDRAVIDNFYIMQQQFLDTERAYGVARTIKVNRPT